MKRLVPAVLLSALFVFAPAVVFACPNCVDSVAANDASGGVGTTGSMAAGISGSMAAGYYYSILFMLAVLFSVAGTFVYLICRHARAATRMTSPEPHP